MANLITDRMPGARRKTHNRAPGLPLRGSFHTSACVGQRAELDSSFGIGKRQVPIYDKPVRVLLRDMVADLGLKPGQVFSRDQALDWFRSRYPKIKEGTVSAHLIRMSTNARSRVHYGAKPDADDLFFQVDGSHFRLFSPETDPPPIYRDSRPPDVEPRVIEQGTGDSDEVGKEFAYESDLRNFLAKNLSILEPGLRLYEDEDITGIEFPVGGRLIDILAVDRRRDYVVIELKVSRAYDRVIGQILRYMGWIEKHHAEPGQKVRGMIIGREISDDLVLACSKLPDVELFRYELSVSVNKVVK